MKSESKLAFVALYPSDYLADTAHLGLLEHGIYWRLLLHYYQHGQPLSADTERLSRIISAMTPEEKRTLEYILPEYFHLENMPDGTRKWVHHRADLEIARAHEVYEMKKSRAYKGAEKRWSKEKQEHGENDDTEKMLKQCLSNAKAYPQAMPEQCLTNAIHNHNHNHNHNPEPEPEPEPEPSASPTSPANPPLSSPNLQEKIKEERTIGGQSSAKTDNQQADGTSAKSKSEGYDPEFIRCWKAYPPRTGGNPKQAAYNAWQARRKGGATVEELYEGTVRYANYCQIMGQAGSQYVKMASTFYGPSLHFQEDWIPAKNGNGNGAPRDKVAATYERSLANIAAMKAKFREQIQTIEGECHEVS